MCYTSGICLNDKATWCNGIDDCGMAASTYTLGTFIADQSEEYASFCRSLNITCDPRTHFQCPTSKQCIDRRFLCDGINNCKEGFEDVSLELCKDKYKKQPIDRFFRHVTNNRTKAWDFAVGCKSNTYCINPKTNSQIYVLNSRLCDGHSLR